jgi:hypothetical protein
MPKQEGSGQPIRLSIDEMSRYGIVGSRHTSPNEIAQIIESANIQPLGKRPSGEYTYDALQVRLAGKKRKEDGAE